MRAGPEPARRRQEPLLAVRCGAARAARARSGSRAPALRRPGRRRGRQPRAGAVADDGQPHADLDGLALGDEDLGQHAGRR